MPLNLKPNSHLSYQALGSSLMMQGRYVEADLAYSQALLLMPKYGLHHFNKGFVCYRSGNLSEASGFFQPVQ
jgi:Flp pilus assembly protein TadD